MTGTLRNLGGDSLHLEVTGGPPGDIGCFLVSTNRDVVNPIPLGPGQLCLSQFSASKIGRDNISNGALNSTGQLDSNGLFVNLSGTSATGTGFDVPNLVRIPGSPIIPAGSTWHFQFWYQDIAGGVAVSNRSNGLTAFF